MLKIWKRFSSLDIYERWMLACVAVAVLLRLVLIAFNWPYTDSDEGNMGVLALHVAFQGDHPIFFYGGPYLGPLEGYMAAPLFRLFGASLLALRLPLLLFFALFLLGMYYLIRLLYDDRKFALVMIILLGLGSPDTLFLQLRASGEYPEIEMFAALMCLLAIWLALTTQRTWGSRRERWKRIGFYGLLGLLIGQALWVDLLVGPFVLACSLLLCLFCWRELYKWSGLSLLLGLVVGAFPLIYYNLSVPWSQNSWFVLLRLQSGGHTQMLAAHLTWVNQLAGTLFIALPMATGGGWGCSPATIPSFGSLTPAALPCVVFQGGWGAGYLLLWLCAAGVAVFALWRRFRRRSTSLELADNAAMGTRRQLIRRCGQLAILVSVGLTLALYADSPAPALASDTSFRYLTCLLLALPVLLWPLWRGLIGGKKTSRWWMRIALLLLIAATLTSGMARTLLQIPTTQARYEEQQALVQDLQQVGATRLYSDYWTCNILIFLSKEKIICSALDTSMNPAQDRYLPYRLMVHATPYPGYIFVVNSSQDKIMQRRVLTNPSHYRIYRFFEYIVYQEI